jgi:hypothetical protein
MGKGIAAQFRKKYPEMFRAYRDICEKKLLEPGKLWLWKAPDQWILNFPTKRHWRYPSKLEWIDAGLEKFVAEYETRGITEISFPRLGCGNGGLDWDEVRPIMEKHLAPLPITTFVHDFEVNIGPPEHLEDQHSSPVRTNRIDRSFEDFVDGLQSLVDEHVGQFRTLHSDNVFKVKFVPENQIEIEFEDGTSRIDVDDLRSIWVKLLNGVVTKRAVEWGPLVRGQHILSLLCMFPEVRLIQIQRSNSEQPEFAVELRNRRGTQLAGNTDNKQPESAWR